MPKTKKKKYFIESSIVSHSHLFDKRSFKKWNKKHGETLDNPISFLFKSKNELTLKIELKEIIRKTRNKEYLLTRGLMMGTLHLISLNIATIGGHIWFLPSLWPIAFKLRENNSKKVTFLKHTTSVKAFYKKKKIIKYNLLKGATIIFISLARLDPLYFKRYIGGMNLLSVFNFGYDFNEEIFANFYKIIERLITVEILKTKKRLKLNEMKKVYKKFGFKDEMLDEVKNIYKIRCNTVMHSVGKEYKIKMEDSLKCKLLADFLLCKYLIQRSKSLIMSKKEKK